MCPGTVFGCACAAFTVAAQPCSNGSQLSAAPSAAHDHCWLVPCIMTPMMLWQRKDHKNICMFPQCSFILDHTLRCGTPPHIVTVRGSHGSVTVQLGKEPDARRLDEQTGFVDGEHRLQATDWSIIPGACAHQLPVLQHCQCMWMVSSVPDHVGHHLEGLSGPPQTPARLRCTAWRRQGAIRTGDFQLGVAGYICRSVHDAGMHHKHAAQKHTAAAASAWSSGSLLLLISGALHAAVQRKPTDNNMHGSLLTFGTSTCNGHMLRLCLALHVRSSAAPTCILCWVTFWPLVKALSFSYGSGTPYRRMTCPSAKGWSVTPRSFIMVNEVS